LADFRSLFLEPLDAAVVAVPTPLHARIAAEFIVRGIHVLVEKPLADTPEAAGQLVSLAQRFGVVLQVGHIERFNPAFEQAAAQCRQPLWIGAVRHGRLLARTLATDVIMDLMIHDLDLILSLTRSQPISIEAAGWSLTGKSLDFAHAQLVFPGGCRATCTASRISRNLTRRLDILDEESLFELDLAARRLAISRRSASASFPFPETLTERGRIFPQGSRDSHGTTSQAKAENPPLWEEWFPCQVEAFPEADPLRSELLDFLTAVQTGSSPRVNGAQGLAAVALADEIRTRVIRAMAGPVPRAAVAAQLPTQQLGLAGPHWHLAPKRASALETEHQPKGESQAL
jgi:predicted dehydrogenase